MTADNRCHHSGVTRNGCLRCAMEDLQVARAKVKYLSRLRKSRDREITLMTDQQFKMSDRIKALQAENADLARFIEELHARLLEAK